MTVTGKSSPGSAEALTPCAGAVHSGRISRLAVFTGPPHSSVRSRHGRHRGTGFGDSEQGLERLQAGVPAVVLLDVLAPKSAEVPAETFVVQQAHDAIDPLPVRIGG